MIHFYAFAKLIHDLEVFDNIGLILGEENFEYIENALETELFLEGNKLSISNQSDISNPNEINNNTSFNKSQKIFK